MLVIGKVERDILQPLLGASTPPPLHDPGARYPPQMLPLSPSWTSPSNLHLILPFCRNLNAVSQLCRRRLAKSSRQNKRIQDGGSKGNSSAVIEARGREIEASDKLIWSRISYCDKCHASVIQFWPFSFLMVISSKSLPIGFSKLLRCMCYCPSMYNFLTI